MIDESTTCYPPPQSSSEEEQQQSCPRLNPLNLPVSSHNQGHGERRVSTEEKTTDKVAPVELLESPVGTPAPAPPVTPQIPSPIIKRLFSLDLTAQLDKYFCLNERGSSIRQEVQAGVISFFALSYVMVLIPRICAPGGVPIPSSMAGTILSIVVSSCLLGLLSNLPLVAGPTAGVASYFATSMTAGEDIPDQAIPIELSTEHAVNALVLAGCVMLVLSILNIPCVIYRWIPGSVKNAMPSGLGLLLSLIGFQGIGLVVPHAFTGIC